MKSWIPFFCLSVIAMATVGYLQADEPESQLEIQHPVMKVGNIRSLPDGGYAVLYGKDAPVPPGAEQASKAVVLDSTEFEALNQKVSDLENELKRVNARRVALLAEVNNQAAEVGRLRGALTRGLQASSIEEFREEMSILVNLSNAMEARKPNE